VKKRNFRVTDYLFGNEMVTFFTKMFRSSGHNLFCSHLFVVQIIIFVNEEKM